MTTSPDVPSLDESLRVLLIEDNPGDARLFEAHLRDSGQAVQFHHEETLTAGLDALDTTPPDVVVLDLGLPDSEGADTVRRCVETAPSVPVVVLTGADQLETALAARRAGAAEYLQKDELSPGLVGRTLRWAIEQHALETQLREREARYRAIAESAQDAIVTMDADSTIQFANPAVEEIFGYAPEELIGESVTTLMPERHRNEHLEALDRYLDTGQETMDWSATEFPGRRKDGTEIALNISFSSYERQGETYFEGIMREVTARKNRERKLRILSEAIDQAEEAILITEAAPLDEPGPRILYVNSAFEAMTGYSEEEVVGKTPRLLQGPETDRAVLDDLRAALEAGESWEGEAINYRKDGSAFMLRWNVAPVQDEEGTIEYWVAVQQDVTEKRVQEQALRRSREEYRSLFRDSNEAILVHDLEGRIVDVNPRAETLFAADASRLIDRSIEHLHAPGAKETARNELVALQAGEPFRAESRYERADGSVFWGELSATVSEIGDETIARTMIRDVTERKQAARKQQQIIRRVTDAIVEVDADWRFTLVNDQAEALYSMDEEDLLGEDFWTVFESARGTRFEETYRRVMETREPDELVEHFPQLGGWFDVQVYPNEDGGLAFYFEDVTERKEREETLRRHRNLLGQAQRLAGAWEVDLRTEEVAWTDKVYEIHEVPPDTDIDLEEAIDFFAPEARSRLRHAFEQCVEAGTPYDLELPLVTANGTRRWVRTVGGPAEVKDGTVVKVAGALQDITERKAAQEALREERDLLDRIFQVSPAAIVLFDREGNFVRASDRAEEVLGLEKDAVAERTYNDPKWDIRTLEGDPIPDEELPFARVIETEAPLYDVEHTIVWPDGSRRLLSVSGAPLRGADGTVEGAVFHIEDITERRIIEERFQGVFENAGIGIALADETGTILEANPALGSMLGREAKALRGCHFADITHPDDLAVDEERFEELVAGERDHYRIEKRYRRADGSTFWGLLTVSRREVPDGVQVVGMVEDIDDRKQHEEQLRAAKEEAERMNRLKSAFLANMSHEIRTPLTSILGFAEVIGEEADDEAEGTIPWYAQRIETSGRRLLETLDGVLNLSKLEAGEMELATEPVDLSDEVEAAAEQFAPRAAEANLDLEVDLCAAPVWIRGDERGIGIILRNLLSNAVKYNEEGGTVCVRVRPGDDRVVLEVEDTGIGMDPAQTEELFEAFTQASEGLGREYEGAGLGLSVTQKVVEEMGGRIDVETEKGEGSCFIVRLPRAENRPADGTT